MCPNAEMAWAEARHRLPLRTQSSETLTCITSSEKSHFGARFRFRQAAVRSKLDYDVMCARMVSAAAESGASFRLRQPVSSKISPFVCRVATQSSTKCGIDRPLTGAKDAVRPGLGLQPHKQIWRLTMRNKADYRGTRMSLSCHC